jgi:HlyD family secretion protein
MKLTIGNNDISFDLPIMKATKLILLSTLLISILWISGCRAPKEENEETYHSKVPVTVTGIQTGTMTDAEDLIATSSFLHKAIVKAPVTGYIEEVNMNPGDFVTRNKLILNLKTKEAAALHYDSTNPLSFSGIVHITSTTDGTIISVDHSKGDYVMEGDQLCSIALPGSLVFIVEVPYELSRYLVSGREYTIALPDGKILNTTLKTRLPGVTGTSQTQRFILQLKQTMSLPENLLAKVRIVKNVVDNAVYLPKSCVLSDEVMKQFWVMKVIGDSLAVRVNVTCGLVQDDKIQILNPAFTGSDLILSSGNYGLGDTATVLITNRKK